MWWIASAGWFALVVMLMACSPGQVSSPMPTAALTQAQASPIPATAIPTITPAPRLGPEDLASAYPEDVMALPSETERAIVWSVLQDAAIQDSLPVSSFRVAFMTPLRWTGTNLHCDPVPADTTTLPLSAARSGYRIVLTSGISVYEYRADAQQRFILCDRAALAEVQGDVLVLIDPVAAEMVGLAQRRLTQQLDLPARRMQLVDIRPVIWPDTSLGCPVEGQTYTPMEVSGYRLVIAAGGSEYIFHTDFDRLVPCARGTELLPQTD